MFFDRLHRFMEGAGPERRHRVWSKLRILVAAIGTLGSATGIAIAVVGLVEFNNQKVIAGVAVIIVCTAVYVSILVRDRNRID
jgi:cysteine synthase